MMTQHKLYTHVNENVDREKIESEIEIGMDMASFR